MKKLLLSGLFAVLLAAPSMAQVEDGSLLENDIVITDTEGVEHSIYEYLDNGQTVILDLFAEWCGPCWNYHNYAGGQFNHPNGGALKDLYNDYGPDGTNELMVFGVESDGSTPATALSGGAGSTYGWDWLDGTPYPMADQNIAGIFNQGYYPYIVMICPNRQIFELGQPSASSMQGSTENCLAAAGNTNPALLDYTGETAVGCEGGNIGTSVLLQNLGMNNLTSATMEVMKNGENVLTFEWEGDLSTYDTEDVDLGDVDIQDPSDLTVEITSTDEGAGDNMVEQEIAFPGTAGSEIVVHFYTDFYALESSWEIRNSMNQVVAEGGPYEAGDEDQFGGGGPDANETMVHNVTLPSADDCYEVRVYDEFGDGLQYGEPDGDFFGVEIFYEGESIAQIALGDFGDDIFIDDVFKTEVTSVDENILDQSLTIFPNPVVNTTTLQTSLTEAAVVSLEVIDLTGKVVYARDMGKQPAGQLITEIDLNSVTNGMYLLNLRVGDASAIRKLSVNK